MAAGRESLFSANIPALRSAIKRAGLDRAPLPACGERGITLGGAGQRQPASLSQACRSVTWDFSHWVIDWVSLSLILLFMQVQYW